MISQKPGAVVEDFGDDSQDADPVPVYEANTPPLIGEIADLPRITDVALTDSISAGGITINLQYTTAAANAPASFRAGIEQAATLLANAITDQITVNIGIDYKGTGGGAAAGPSSGQFVSYSTVLADLQNNESNNDHVFDDLPTGTTIGGQTQVAVWNAQLKAMGIISGTASAQDGSAFFATDIDPSLLPGVALHELTHAMGRVPYGPPDGAQSDVFDFFRFTSTGNILLDDHLPASASAYFSLTNGATKIADYGVSSDPSDFLNTGVQGQNDPFNEFYQNSTTQTLTKVDLKQLDALGFHVIFPDSAPTGSVTISGTAISGQTLTASNTLADADGLGTISYQWQADGTNIAGATSNTLLLAQAQVGKVVTVVASYTDGFATHESVTSSGTSTVTSSESPPTGSVTITGTPTQGQTLTASNTLADADGLGTIGYQWSADGTPIGGATGNTLLLAQAQVGKVITVVASYTDGHGNAEAVSSSGTTTVANVNDPPTGSVTISGNAVVGETLTASNTLADLDGLGTISYLWKADGNAIGGATNSTFMITASQFGAVITVVASYTDGFGANESVSSSGTSAVLGDTAPTGAPVVTGTVTQGQVLGVDTSSIADADGLGAFSYQWLRDGSTITNATASTYTPVQADVGHAISVSVSYMDGHGHTEVMTSDPTADVANVNDAPTGAPIISGSTVSGQTLTADPSGIADADGLGTFSYQWNAGGNPVGGATSSTFKLTPVQAGSTITVTVSYTDGFGTSESVTSTATAAVTIPPGITVNGTSAADTITGTDGADVLNGANGNDTINGGWSNDTITGGAGTDVLNGQEGSDLYIVTAATEHTAAEFADTGTSGTDEVRFTAASGTLTIFAGDTGIERVVLGTGTGASAVLTAKTALGVNATAAPNALEIIGNAGVNTITGTAFDDTIDGGAGADKMTGGNGNDLYIVDNAKDVITEGVAGGTDTVDASVSYVLGANVENLVLTGVAAINGTGNELNNTITGNSATNVIDGKAGLDVLDGAGGSDIYLIDAVADHPAAEIADSGSSGIDEVRFASAVASTLVLFAGDTGIETVTIGTGTAAKAVTTGKIALNVDASAVENGLSILGNSGANIITGTAFNDTLTGGGGNDTLTGGSGNDAFVFNVAPNAKTNLDTITDFTSGSDSIELSKAIFKAFTVNGALADTQFFAASGAVKGHDADDRIIYNTDTGALYYDVDGSGSKAAVEIAVLTGHPDIVFSDILIVS